MENNNDFLLEPCEGYEKHYKQAFADNTKGLFEKLLKESAIDADENRRVAKEYRASLEAGNALKKKIGRLKLWRVLLIILALIGGCVFAYGISEKIIWAISASPVAVIGALALIFAVLNKKIKAKKSELNTVEEKTKGLYDEAMGLIAPLLTLFEGSMTQELIKQTVPTLEIDKAFDMKRYDYLNGKYGYGEDDGESVSTVGIMSGEIVGNPFVFEKKLRHTWGTQTYTGTLTIHWTTYTTVNGKREAQHHTQVLHASVRKPKPFFTYDTDLVYGNEAAPDLSFSREATHAERLSEHKQRSFIKERTKKIQKLAKKNVDTGFTELGNNEFDALFGAFDRDHEVQFRLLFTPLAQKNLIDIIKGGSPYGDDFDIVKSKCINIERSEHAQSREFTINPEDYFSYDVDLCAEKFQSLNEDYFCSVFFDFAPLLSIPMYQQIKPREYIYKASYDRNYTVREAEVMANRIGFNALSHPRSVTPAILKTRLLSTDKDIDRLSVHALSYKTVSRVDFVPVLGGDGHIHNVPVPWLLYIPLEQNTQIELKQLDMTECEYKNSSYAQDSDKHIFFHSIFTTLGEIDSMDDSSPDEKDDDISEYGGITEE